MASTSNTPPPSVWVFPLLLLRTVGVFFLSCIALLAPIYGIFAVGNQSLTQKNAKQTTASQDKTAMAGISLFLIPLHVTVTAVLSRTAPFDQMAFHMRILTSILGIYVLVVLVFISMAAIGYMANGGDFPRTAIESTGSEHSDENQPLANGQHEL